MQKISLEYKDRFRKYIFLLRSTEALRPAVRCQEEDAENIVQDIFSEL